MQKVLPTIDSEENISSGVLIEKTRMVVSFINEKDLTEKALKEISDFRMIFGSKTNQEAVAFVLDGEMFYIDIQTKK